MKIAIPTNDGSSISEHFGRSAAFLIFETENGKIKSHEMKSNQQRHTHPQGDCKHGAAEGKKGHHEGILSTLNGCDVVICAGMGQRAAQALKGGGVTTIIFTSAGPAEAAVSSYLAGKLTTNPETFCRCSH